MQPTIGWGKTFLVASHEGMDTCIFRSSKTDTSLTLHCLTTTPCMSMHSVTLGQVLYCGICESRHHITYIRANVCVLSLPSLLLHGVMFYHRPCVGCFFWCCQNIPFSYTPCQKSHCVCFLCTIGITVKCDKYQNASSFLRGCITAERKEGQSVILRFSPVQIRARCKPFFSLLEGVFLSLTFSYGGTYCLSQPDNTSDTSNVFVSILHQSSQHCKPSFLSKYFSPS